MYLLFLSILQKFTKEAEEVVKKAKNKLLDPSEIKPPFNGPFKVYCMAVLAVFMYNVLL